MKCKFCKQKIKPFMNFGKMSMAIDFFKKNYPEVALLCSWNHKNEIFKKENKFKKIDGRCISHVV